MYDRLIVDSNYEYFKGPLVLDYSVFMMQRLWLHRMVFRIDGIVRVYY